MDLIRGDDPSWDHAGAAALSGMEMQMGGQILQTYLVGPLMAYLSRMPEGIPLGVPSGRPSNAPSQGAL